MKLKTLLTLAAALVVTSGPAFAQEEDTPLSKEMSAMNRAWRKLKKQAADPAQKESSLALVATMKEKSEAALKFEPAQTKDQPEADKAAYLEKYKEMVTALGRTLDELKEAIEKGDNVQITALFEKVSDEKEKGHEKFAPDE